MGSSGPMPSASQHPDKARSLRAHLAILFALTASLMLAGLALVFLHWEDAEARSRVESELTEAASHTTALIESTLQRQLNALAMAAAVPTLVRAVEASDVDTLTHLLSAMVDSNPDFARLAILNSQGILVANSSADKSAIGRDFSQLSYVAAALRERQPQVGEPRPAISQQTTVAVFPLGTPIVGTTGATIGVLQSTTELARISTAWSQLRVGASGFIVVRSATGHVIVHPDETRLLQQLGDSRESLHSTAESLLPLWLAAGHGTPAYFAQTQVSEPTGWTVRAQVPVAEVIAPISRHLFTSVSIAGLLAAVAALIGLRASRRLSIPLEQLTRAVQAEQESEITVAIAPSQVREITALSQAYQRLRERLAERTRQHEAAESELRAHAERLGQLTRVNQSMASSLSTADVLTDIAAATASLMAARVVMIWVVDPQSQSLHLRAATDPEFMAPAGVTHVPIGFSVPGWVALHRRELRIDDLQRDSRVMLSEWWRERGISSVLAIPLLDGDDVIAVIALMGTSPFCLTKNDEDVLAMFVSQASVAVRNSRLFAAEASARARAEAAEQQLRALLDAAPDGVLVADERGTVLLANRMIAEMSDRPLSEIIGRSGADLVTPESRPVLEMLVRESMAAPGEVVQSAGHAIGGARSDGVALPLEISMTAIRAPGGWNRISVIRDGSQRIELDRQKDLLLASERRARREAELAAQQVRTLIESAADAILSVDQDGRIDLVNARLEELFGYSREELLGQSVELLLPEDLRSVHAAHRTNFTAAAKARPMGAGLDLRGRRKDGSELPVEVSLGPVETPDGQRYFGVIVDVTNQRELARQKDQFVSIVSHELRTPLTPILGLAELLLSTSLNDQQRRMIETINRSGKNLLAIVNDLLDLSKLQGGHVQLERLPVATWTLIEDTIDPISLKANDKGITLLWEIADDVPQEIVADPVRLRQILTNLLDNAVKFTVQGTVLLRLERQETTPIDDVLRFSVTDSGIGIAPSAAARIFEPFTQASSSTMREFGGTGLGLAVCKQLVQLMGGSIGVTSVEGKGSTFAFTARVGRPERPATVAASAVAAPIPVGLRILVADRRAVVRRWLHQVLGVWGATVEVTDSGAVALSRLRSQAEAGTPFDLLFLQPALADPGGLDLARAVSLNPLLARTAMILLAAHGREGQRGEAEDGGIRAVSRFPMSRAELSALVQAAMSPPAISPVSDALSLVSTELTTTEGHGRPAEILVVDDSPMNQLVIVSLLRQLGYEARTADSGRAALAALTGAHSYRAILMDCQMPDMDGFEATARIRQSEAAPNGRHVPVIAMTASAMSDQRVQCLAAGMDDFLTKPIDLDAFAAALERWTGGPAHRQPVETHPVAEHPLLGADRGAELDRATLTVLDTLRTPDGHSMVDAVITSYTASAPEHVQELTRLLVDGELDAALGTAHRLAGESGTVGATGVCRLAQQLETACGDRATKAELQAQLSLLSAAVPAAVAALHAYQREAFRASGGTAR